MDFIGASASPIVVSIGNKEWTFSILTLRECGELISVLRKEAREDLIALLKDGELEDKMKVVSMQQFQTNPHGMSDLLIACHTPEGVRRIFFTSLKKKHPKLTEEQMDEIPFVYTQDISAFCYTLLGAKLEKINTPGEVVTEDQEPDEIGDFLDKASGVAEKKTENPTSGVKETK